MSAAANAKKGGALAPTGIPLSEYRRKEDPRPTHQLSRPSMGGGSGLPHFGMPAPAGSPTAASPTSKAAATQGFAGQQVPAAASSAIHQLGAFSVVDGRRILTPSGLPYTTRHKFHYVKDVNTTPYSNGLFGSAPQIQGTSGATTAASTAAAATALPKEIVNSNPSPLGQAASFSGLPPTSPNNPRRVSVSPSNPALASPSSYGCNNNHATGAGGGGFSSGQAVPVDVVAGLPRRAKTPSLSLPPTSSFLLPPGANALSPIRPSSASGVLVAETTHNTPARSTRPGTSGSPRATDGRPPSQIRPPSSSVRIASCGLPTGATATVAAAPLSESPWRAAVRLPHANPQGAAGGGRVLSSAATGIRPMSAELYQEFEEDRNISSASGAGRSASRFSMAQRNPEPANDEDIYDALALEAGERATQLLSDFPPASADTNYRPSREQIAAYLEGIATWWPVDETAPTAATATANPLLAEAARLRSEEAMVTTTSANGNISPIAARLSVVQRRRSLSVVSVATEESAANSVNQSEYKTVHGVNNNVQSVVAVGSPAFASHLNGRAVAGTLSPQKILLSQAKTAYIPHPYATMSALPLAAVPLAVCGIDVGTVFSADSDNGNVARAMAKAGLAGQDEVDFFPPPPEVCGSGHATARPTDNNNNGNESHERSPCNSSISGEHQHHQVSDSQRTRRKNGIVEVASLVRSVLLLKEVVEDGGAIAEQIGSAVPTYRQEPSLVNSLLKAKAITASHQRLFGHHIAFTDADGGGKAAITSQAASTSEADAAAPSWEFTFDNSSTAPHQQPTPAQCPYALKTCIDSQHFILQVGIRNEGGTVIGCHLFEVPLSEQPEVTGEPLSVPSLTARLSSIINDALQGAIEDEPYLCAIADHLATGKTTFANGYTLPTPLEDPSQTAANTRRNHAALCLLTNTAPGVSKQSAATHEQDSTSAVDKTSSSTSPAASGPFTQGDFDKTIANANLNNQQLSKKLTSAAFAVTVNIQLCATSSSSAASGPSDDSTQKSLGPIEGTILTNAGLSLLCQLRIGRDSIEVAQSTAPAKASFDRLACGDDEDEEADYDDNKPFASSIRPKITTIIEAQLTSAIVRTHAAIVSASSLSRASLVVAAFAQREHRFTMDAAASAWGTSGSGVRAGAQIGPYRGDARSPTKQMFQLQPDELSNNNSSASISGVGDVNTVECLVRSPVPADGLRSALQQAAASLIAKQEQLSTDPNATPAEDVAPATTVGGGAKRGMNSTIGTAAKRMSIAPRGTLVSGSPNGAKGGAASPLRAGSSDPNGTNGANPQGSEVSPLLLLSVGQGALPDAVALNHVVASMDASAAVAIPAKRKSVSPAAASGSAANAKRLSSTDAAAAANAANTNSFALPGTVAGVSTNILLAPDGQMLVATVTINLNQYREQNKRRLQIDAEVARRREAQQLNASVANGLLLQQQMENTKGRRGSNAAKQSAAASGGGGGTKSTASRSPATSPATAPLADTLSQPSKQPAPLSLMQKSFSSFSQDFSLTADESQQNAATEGDGAISFWFTRSATSELQTWAAKSSQSAPGGWWEATTIELALPDPFLLPIAVAAVAHDRARQAKAMAASSSTLIIPPPVLHCSLRTEDGPAFSSTPFARPADTFSLTCNSLDVYLRSRLVPLGPKSKSLNKSTLHQALFATRSAGRSLIAFAGAPLQWSRDEAKQFVLADRSEVSRAGKTSTYAPNAHMSLVSGHRGFSTLSPTSSSSVPICSSTPIANASFATFVYLGSFHSSVTAKLSGAPAIEAARRASLGHHHEGINNSSSLENNNRNIPTPSPGDIASMKKLSQQHQDRPMKAAGGTRSHGAFETTAPSPLGPLLTHVLEIEPQSFTNTTICLQVRTAAGLGEGIHGGRDGRIVRATFIAHPSAQVARLVSQVQTVARELVATVTS